MSSLLSLGESFCDDDHPLLEPIAEHLEQVARVRSRVRADRRRRGWTVIVGSEGVRWVLAEVLAEVLAVHGPSTARVQTGVRAMGLGCFLWQILRGLTSRFTKGFACYSSSLLEAYRENLIRAVRWLYFSGERGSNKFE